AGPECSCGDSSSLTSSSAAVGLVMLAKLGANAGPLRPGSVQTPTAALRSLSWGRNLADRAFHLKLDQALELDAVFHRELPDEIVHETVYAQAHRLRLGQTALLHVKNLLGADLADARFVLNGVARAAHCDRG